MRFCRRTPRCRLPRSAPGSACRRRRAGSASSGWRSEGVIQKRVALVDQDRIGLGVTIFVSIETGDHSQEWLDRFAQVVGAMPEVMEFYRMAGDVDYMLRVVVPDIAGYDTFYKKLIAAVPLKNVTSRFAMEKIKSTTALPIPEVRSESADRQTTD